MSDSREKTVLGTLVRTLQPVWETGVLPALERLQRPASARAAPAQARAADGPPRFASNLPRTNTDENLITELEQITRQDPRLPKRVSRRYRRAELLDLLDEARLRIQVLETELELARGASQDVPLLTEEWSLPEPTPEEPLEKRPPPPAV